MKNQQVSTEWGAVARAMLTYGAVTALCWLMLRLFSAVISLPRRIRAQQDQIKNSLQELQSSVPRGKTGPYYRSFSVRLSGRLYLLKRRFPDLNITEDELKNAEKELDELTQEFKDKENGEKPAGNETPDEPKKTI